MMLYIFSIARYASLQNSSLGRKVFKAFNNPSTGVVVLVSNDPLPGRSPGWWVAVSDRPQPGLELIPVTGVLTNGRADGNQHSFPNDTEEIVVTLQGTTPVQVVIGGALLEAAPWVERRHLVFEGLLLRGLRHPE
jgi:hypothetical protein